MPQMASIGLITAVFLFSGLAAARAQTPPAPVTPAPDKPASPLAQQYDCPPGVDPNKAPLLGEETSGSGETLSEQLAASRGIVCPPRGVDPGIVEPPPAGGTLRVIPPPTGDTVPK